MDAFDGCNPEDGVACMVAQSVRKIDINDARASSQV